MVCCCHRCRPCLCPCPCHHRPHHNNCSGYPHHLHSMPHLQHHHQQAEHAATVTSSCSSVFHPLLPLFLDGADSSKPPTETACCAQAIDIAADSFLPVSTTLSFAAAVNAPLRWHWHGEAAGNDDKGSHSILTADAALCF